MVTGVHPMMTIPFPTLGPSQQSSSALQVLPPTPITVTGVQVTPQETFGPTELTGNPSRVSRASRAGFAERVDVC